MMHATQRKNFTISTAFGLAWIAFFAVMAMGGTSFASPSIPLLVVPLILGGAYVAFIKGEPVNRVLYALGMPIVPVLVVTTFLSRNTDSEGAGFVWLYASAPLLPFWIGAAAVLIAMAVRKRMGSKHTDQQY